MMKLQQIRAGKVILRPKRIEDAEDDYTWRCDEELAELDASSPIRQSFDEFLRYYKDDLHRQSPSSIKFAIDDLNGNHIGNVMCYDINLNFGEAELGVMIGKREYWNKSFGYHTLAGLIDHMFLDRELRLLYLHTLDWNFRAQRSFQKCGFIPKRTIHRSGRDLIRMELERNYWLEHRSSKLAPLRKIDAVNKNGGQ